MTRVGVARWVLVAAALGPTTGAGLSSQDLPLIPAGVISGPLDLVEAEGTFAYVTRGGTLRVFDIADPTMPVALGSHTLPEEIWGFTVIGSTAYVAAGHSGLWILDLSDPTNPTVRGSVTTPGQAKNVAVSGDRAVVADHMSGIDVIDISDPTAPIAIGSVYTDGYARDVAMSGTLAYGVDNPSGFYVLDMSASDPLEPVSALQSAIAPRYVEVLGSDPRIAVLAGGTPYDPLRALRDASPPEAGRGSLHVYDVSDPSAPVTVASVPTPGGGVQLAIDGALVYVADGSEGLTVVDLSDPAQPTIVGRLETDAAVRDVAVAEGAVLILTGTQRPGAHTHDDGDVVILRREP